jgi:hypothetical protein
MKSHSFPADSRWQKVFSLSKVNGAYYDGEKLPTLPWDWPKDTFLQRRREFLKNSRAADPSHSRHPGITAESDGNVFESVCSDYARSGTGHRYYKDDRPS